MTLVLKHIKSKYKDYLFYLVSSIFGVSGYIILSCYLHALNSIIELENIKILSKDIGLLRNVSYFYLLLSFFFILYTFLYYSKKQSRDYAILIILGEKKRNIFSYFVVEIVITYFASIILGTVVGVTFYYGSLFLLKSFHLYSYDIIIYPIKKYLCIYSLYFILYFLSIVWSYIRLQNTKLVDLLTEERMRDELDKSGWFKFILGAGISLISMYLVLIQLGDLILRTLVSILLISIGVYLLFSSMAFPILQLLKSKNELYYKNYLYINNFVFRFNKLKKIIYISFLSGLILFVFLGSAIYNGINANSVESRNQMYPNDFVIQGYAKLDNLVDILRKSDMPLHMMATKILFIENSKNIGDIKCMLIDDYNNFQGKKFKVKDGEVIGIELRLPETFEPFEGDSHISIARKEKRFGYKIKQAYWENTFGIFENYGNEYLLLMNEQDYTELEEYANCRYYIFVNAENPKDISRLTQLFEKYKQDFKDDRIDIYAKNKYVEMNKNATGTMMLVTMFIGIIVILFKNTVIYINTFNDLDSLVEKYTAYYIIGMGNKQICHIAKKEYRLPFFIPIVLSYILTGLYIYILTLDGLEQRQWDIFCFFSTLLFVYLLIELIYYETIKKKLISVILDGLEK